VNLDDPSLALRYELRQRILWRIRALIDDRTVEFAKNPDHQRAKLVKLTECDGLLYGRNQAPEK
jgi:hypothetical protein